MFVDFRRGLAAAGALLLASACAHIEARPPGPEIATFEIVGNDAVEEREIKERVVTDSPSWLPFTQEPRFNRNVWASDLERVRRFYQTRGFYQVEVEDAVDLVGRDRVRLVLRVAEGLPTRIRSVEITGLDTLPAEQQALVIEQLKLDAGDIFLEEVWETAGNRVRAALQALGYAEADVESEAVVDLATRAATLRIEVDPGLRYRFGEIRIEGVAADIEPHLVEELVREELEDEPWFTPDALEEATQRLVGLGVFGVVLITPGEGNPETRTVPVIVDVTDAPLRELAIGGGLAIRPLLYSAGVLGRFAHYNFLGGLRFFSVDARAGWAFIPNAYSEVTGQNSLVSRSGPIARVVGELRQPRLLHPNVALATRLTLERSIEPAFSFYGGAARVGVPWRPKPWLVLEASYNLELYRLDAGVTDLETTAPRILFGCTQTCALSYLEQAIALDFRDNRIDPKRGYYLGVALQEGGGPLGGSFDYIRVVPEARGYVSFPPSNRVTLAGRVRLGTLIPLSGGTFDSPIVSRFFSGGDGMRGFSVQRLSPTRLIERQTRDGIALEPVPIGGNGLFESSVELRYSLTPTITLATFVDAGFVTSQSIEFEPSYFTDNMLFGVGGGVRYLTPVGPVRLDLAYRPNIGPPLPVYDPPGTAPLFLPGSGCFGIGETSADRAGSPEGVCAIHLSIGEAF